MSTRFDFQGFSGAHDRLIAEYRGGRASHALLLCGSSGMLKNDFARYLANILLCQAASGDRPCGSCPSCLRFETGKHGNLLALGLSPGAKTIKIDQLRSLLNALSLHPLESGPRVILLSDIHAMTVQAQNVLLKSLEEPLAQDYYLITCDNEQAVLPTIISRCSQVRLPALDENAMEARLKQSGLDAEEAAALSGLTGGRLGYALDISRDTAYSDLKALAEKTIFQVRKFSDIPAASILLKDARDSADLLLDLLEEETRHSLACRYLGSAEKRPAVRWASVDPSALKRVLEAVFEARKYKASNVSWQAIVDRLLFTITKEIYQCQWS